MDKKVWLALAILSLGGCRIVSQQELADLKSPPNPHMANIDQTWQKNIVPQVVENARPVAELMAALQAEKDVDAACKTLGYRSQEENPCIFYVKVEGSITNIDAKSRSGKMTSQISAAQILSCRRGQLFAARFCEMHIKVQAMSILTIRFYLVNMVVLSMSKPSI